MRALFSGYEKQIYRCGAGKWIVGVDTNGDLYPCGPMIGLQGCKIGSVFTGIDESAKRFYEEDLLVTRKLICKVCWARYMCGGGCYQAAFLANGGAHLPDPWDCELIQHLIQLAIHLVACLQQNRPAVSGALSSKLGFE